MLFVDDGCSRSAGKTVYRKCRNRCTPDSSGESLNLDVVEILYNKFHTLSGLRHEQSAGDRCTPLHRRDKWRKRRNVFDDFPVFELDRRSGHSFHIDTLFSSERAPSRLMAESKRALQTVASAFINFYSHRVSYQTVAPFPSTNQIAVFLIT